MKPRTILSVFVAAGVVLTACGSDDNGASTSATTAPAAAVTTPGSTNAAANGDATLMIATDPVLGDHVVDGQGRTLYLFEQDQGTTTACTGGCADNWPPIVADGAPTAGEGIDAAELATADGIEPDQITYHGHLLYYFSGDQAAGDTNGIGIPDWYAVDPAGNAIETG
jgi:predicted lipoprotein with Yx(FWY)xxD motif